SAIVTNTTRSWNDSNGDLVPQCDLRNPNANGECGPMANKNFGQQVFSTTADPNWIQGWGKRPYSWAWSVSLDHELASGVALTAGFYRTTYGNFNVTRNAAVTPADYTSYCIQAPTDPRLPAGVSGQQICGLADINPDKFGLVNNVVTLASNFRNASANYNALALNPF